MNLRVDSFKLVEGFLVEILRFLIQKLETCSNENGEVVCGLINLFLNVLLLQSNRAIFFH